MPRHRAPVTITELGRYTCAHCSTRFAWASPRPVGSHSGSGGCRGGGKPPKFCSHGCQQKWYKVKRRARVNQVQMEAGIDWESVAKRDGLTCHLCQLQCDPTDHDYVNGYHRCGRMYPSVDHLLPIIHKGPHTWANVKLAHVGCNSRKRDQVTEVGGNPHPTP